ncbi:hypothetical protein B5G06_00820 [Flavonifractor sp. An52]|nr:hypothetical protein B5G06_00820 [Flavonifractor sp. An52]OUO13619.1 hypothetical protein B5F94_09820 [Flavonifractor sp. An4]
MHLSKREKIKLPVKAGIYDYEQRAGAISLRKKYQFQIERGDIGEAPNCLLLKDDASGFTFGYLEADDQDSLVGIPEGEEGNILVVGGNGSGKSYGVAAPTLKSWHGAICATDIKGELSKRYEVLYQSGTAVRPYLIFDPTQTDGPSYDPFWWLLEDSASNLMSNIWEIVLAIVPAAMEDNQPFWVESEQALFAASLLYFFKLGLSFSETVCEIMSTDISSLCETISVSEDVQVKMLLGSPMALKADVLAAIDRGLRNKLMLFASDPYIGHAFRGVREGAMCFNWNDLEHTNIFLHIPANKVEQWGGAVNLMLTQLLRYLERRPEKYCLEAEQIPQTLLLLDEFARFGKLEMLPAAMATLRSKKVNICLMVQSIAQIDAIYGESERRIILDNCQFQAILRANDPETQETLCKLIGTRIQRHHSVSQQLGTSMKDTVEYSIQTSEVRDWMVCPHELATLKDVLLLTPHGFLRVQKFAPSEINVPSRSFTNTHSNPFFCNEGAVILMIEERIKNADRRTRSMEHQRRLAQKQANDNKRKQKDQLKYILGGLVLKYFPELSEIVPERTETETQERFRHIEVLLSYLSNRRDLVQQLQDNASSKASTIS